MSKDDLKPKTIAAIPFPDSTQTTGTIEGGGTSDSFNAQQIEPLSFPSLNIATQLRSSTLDTETRTINSNFTFQRFGAISIGSLSNATPPTGTGIRISPNGIYGYALGVPTFSLNAITGAFLTTGYIQVGGAAADVNGGLTLIGAGKILISGVSTLASWSSGADATYIDGGKLYTGTVTADTVRAAWVYAGNIAASQITSGTIYVGGGSEPAALYIRQGTISDSAKLRWTGGSRIWEDTSNRMGINSIGSPMYIYVNSVEKIVIPQSGQTSIRGGVFSDGNLDLNQADYISALGTAAQMRFDGEIIRFYNNATDLEVSIHTNDGGKIYTDKDEIVLGNYTLKLTGAGSGSGYTITHI